MQNIHFTNFQREKRVTQNRLSAKIVAISDFHGLNHTQLRHRFITLIVLNIVIVCAYRKSVTTVLHHIKQGQ